MLYDALVLQAAQKQLEQQVEAAQQLSLEVEQLKNENLEAWKVKYDLESQMAAYKASLDGMQRQGSGIKKVGTGSPLIQSHPSGSSLLDYFG